MAIAEEQTSVELLRRARRGEDEALDQLLRRYLAPLRSWATHRLPPWARDAMDTSDIVQETLLRSFRHLQTFEPNHDGALQAYLRQAVRNRIRDELRRTKTRRPAVSLPSNQPAPHPSQLEQVLGHEKLARYEAALERLDEEDRDAIIARMELKQTWEQVAAVLGKPSADAARKTVSRALERLAREMALDAPG